MLVPALIAAQPMASPQGKPVGGVEIVTAEGEKPTIVEGRLKTHVGGQFDQNQLDGDLKSLSQQYERIDPQIEVRDGQVYVTLRVWPRPLVHEIIWKGNERLSAKRLNKELEVTPHELFDRAAFQKGFHKVKALYVKDGFYDAQLDYRIVPAGPGQVDIEITVDEGQVGRIQEVRFEGLTEDEEADLCERLVTQEYNFLVSWLTEWGTYRPDAVEHDRMQVLRYLQDKGYADAQVTVTTEEIPDQDRIAVVITVDKGPVFHFGKVVVQGDLILPEKIVIAQVAAHPGDHFSPEALHASTERLTNLYGAKGYIEPEIQYELHLRPEEHIYDVVFTIRPGEVFRVGMVHISGNCQTQQRVILHESLVVPGEVFDLRRLKGTEERLQNVGYFKSVRVYTTPSNEAALGPEYRDVHIEVEEENTGNVSLFAGFSTLDQIFGGAELVERNFNIKGIPTIFKKGLMGLRGGGEYAQLRLTVGQNETSYLFKWTKPYFYDTRWIFGFDLEHSNNRQYSHDYTLDNTSGLVHATYPYNDFVRLGTLYRLRWSYKKVGHDANEILKIGPKTSLISAVGGSWAYDSTNAISYPSKGIRSEALVEVAGLGGTNHFLGLSYLNKLYYPLWESQKITMKWRADFRFIQPFAPGLPHIPEHLSLERFPEKEVLRDLDEGPVSISERLFLGGEDTVRGYVSYSIGPRYKTGAPFGGLSSILLSEEIQWRWTGWLAPFVFVDGGMVSLKRWDVDAFRVSAGFGTRIDLLPSMPLTVGMGWPINPQHDSDIQRFFFSVGARF